MQSPSSFPTKILSPSDPCTKIGGLAFAVVCHGATKAARCFQLIMLTANSPALPALHRLSYCTLTCCNTCSAPRIYSDSRALSTPHARCEFPGCVMLVMHIDPLHHLQCAMELERQHGAFKVIVPDANSLAFSDQLARYAVIRALLCPKQIFLRLLCQVLVENFCASNAEGLRLFLWCG